MCYLCCVAVAVVGVVLVFRFFLFFVSLILLPLKMKEIENSRKLEQTHLSIVAIAYICFFVTYRDAAIYVTFSISFLLNWCQKQRRRRRRGRSAGENKNNILH